MEPTSARPKLVPLIAFLALWIASWLILFQQDPLDGAPDRARFLIGEIVTAAIVGVALLLARRIPIPTAATLAVREPRRELLVGLAYLVAVLAGAQLLGLSTHVASVGMTDATMAVWHGQTVRSVLSWVGYFFLTCVLVPLVVARWRGYGAKSMLLGFPRGLRWIIYCVVAASISLSAFVGPSYFRLPVTAHLLAVVVFSLGTFLPVAILIQGLLVPRLMLVSRSWLTGAVLGGLVYGVYHSGEFFMGWSGATALVSAGWFMQFAFIGMLKAVTTLRTGSVWIHVFNTHMPHLAEAPALAEVFGLEG